MLLPLKDFGTFYSFPVPKPTTAQHKSESGPLHAHAHIRPPSVTLCRLHISQGVGVGVRACKLKSRVHGNGQRRKIKSRQPRSLLAHASAQTLLSRRLPVSSCNSFVFLFLRPFASTEREGPTRTRARGVSPDSRLSMPRRSQPAHRQRCVKNRDAKGET